MNDIITKHLDSAGYKFPSVESYELKDSTVSVVLAHRVGGYTVVYSEDKPMHVDISYRDLLSAAESMIKEQANTIEGMYERVGQFAEDF